MQTEPTPQPATITEPGRFETIIKYEQPTSMSTAFNDHLMESDAQGIDRHGRKLSICRPNADRTEWHLRTEPIAPACEACKGKGCYACGDTGDDTDFPCCAPGGEGH